MQFPTVDVIKRVSFRGIARTTDIEIKIDAINVSDSHKKFRKPPYNPFNNLKNEMELVLQELSMTIP